ncbi:MAG: alpha/beta fold hydrolase BchO [Pseudomonadota bacterium]
MDWAAARETWPHAAHSRFVETRAHRWHVQRLGQGPKVLLLHGAGASTHSWAGMIPHLSAHAEILSVDLPGHGFTRAQRFSRARLPEMAADLTELLAAERFLPQRIAGHSAGAAVALQIALDDLAAGRAGPERIIAFNPALVPFEGLAGMLFPPLAKLLALNPFVAPLFARTASSATARNIIASTGSEIPREGVELYARLIKDRAHVDGALKMMARWDLTPLLDRLPRLETPATFVLGRRDGTVAPENGRRQAARMPQARVVEKDLGHLMHEEAPALCAAQVLDGLGGGEERQVGGIGADT